MTPYETIELEEKSAHVFLLRLNRPEVRNAFNTQMSQEVADCVKKLPRDARALVVTGSGNKAFSAGADLKERKGMDLPAWRAQHKFFEEMIAAISGASFPVIAAVNGAAFGGGLEIILACDFAYTVPEAQFSFSEAKLGIIPGLGGIYRLTKLVGPARAKELVCTAGVFTSKQAHEWGILSELIQANELLEFSLKRAKQIATNAPLAVAAGKKAVDLSNGIKLADWSKLEHQHYYKLVESEDRQEGVLAFNEKRKAEFVGK